MSTQIKSQNKLIYSAYDIHPVCNLNCPPEEDKTKQSFGDECDINLIVARYLQTGVIESGSSTPAQYGVATAFDFQEAQNIIIQAESMFNALAADVRFKFNNDPVTMLAWIDDPQNEAQAVAMGLLQAAEGVGDGFISPAPEVAPTPPKTPAIDLHGNAIPTP